MQQRGNLVLPSPQELAMMQAQHRAAQQQANNQIAFARAAMAASAAGSIYAATADREEPTIGNTNGLSRRMSDAVNEGFQIADACLKRIGLNIEQPKEAEVGT